MFFLFYTTEYPLLHSPSTQFAYHFLVISCQLELVIEKGAFLAERRSRHQAGQERRPATSSRFSHSTRDTGSDAYRTDGRKSNRTGTPQYGASRASGTAHYSAQRKTRKRGKVVKSILIAVLIVVAAAGTAVALYVNNINSRLNQGIDSTLKGELVTVERDDPFYILLLGVDKDEARSESWGSDDSNYRSDTIILARVDPKSQKITLVSIPRDTLVDMGDYGEQKINAAYSLGGPGYMVEVVSKFAGVSISHYAELDFEQFTSIVDTIGGVEVTLPVAVSDMDNAGIDLPAGTQTLDGTEALGLCRSRHAYDAYGGGDFYRAANQRMVIAAIVKKVLSLDAVTMSATVSQLADSVNTDLSATDILSLANQFKDLDVDNDVYSGQTPTDSQLINGGWYEIVKTDEWTTMMQRVDDGETPYSDESQDFTAGVAGSIGSSSTSDTVDLSSLDATYSGTVLVLNATSTKGLATNKANALTAAGFSSTADNADNTTDTSAIYYNGDSDKAAEALGVADKLGLDSSVISKNDGTYSEKYDVVVVLGEDAVD